VVKGVSLLFSCVLTLVIPRTLATSSLSTPSCEYDLTGEENEQSTNDAFEVRQPYCSLQIFAARVSQSFTASFCTDVQCYCVGLELRTKQGGGGGVNGLANDLMRLYEETTA
jgi:hypothetical protein